MSYSPWIKIETTTPDKPEVIAMATRLRVKDPDTVTGKLVRLWAWADANSVDGHDISITRAFIDRLTSCRGFAAAMESVGWLVGKDGLLSFPGFERHNGDSAKKRAGEARKKSKQRGQTGGQMSRSRGDKPGDQEIEIEEELGERESGREALEFSNPPEPDLVGRVNGCRPEWAAAPVLSPPELEALRKNRAALQALTPETWAAILDYLAAPLPEGKAGWQPRQRLRFIETAGDVAAQATSWKHGSGAGKPTAGKAWPAAFEQWAAERYPSTPPRVLWMAPTMRTDYEQWQRGEDAA